jgi:peptidoglycan/xylan/chitin deacetylase (PgdA/CDA1 family)
VCWTPAQLTHNTGDEKIRKRVREALVSPPPKENLQYSPLLPSQRGSIRRVRLPLGKKLIALTFDLCEQPDEVSGYQGGVVDFLRSKGVKSTFFIGGKWMVTHSERAEQLIGDPLFEIGNHTWEHRNLRLLKGKELSEEVENANFAYARVRGTLEAKQCLRRDKVGFAHEGLSKTPKIFRFPFGACSPEALNTVANMGMLSIQWDVSSGDPTFGQTAEMIKKDVLARVRPGSIVLFHANGRGWHTGAALPDIITQLKKENYEFVTVSELLAAGEWEITPSCFDSKPHDTERYDGLARRLLTEYAHFKEVAATRSGVVRSIRKEAEVTLPKASERSQSTDRFLSNRRRPMCDPNLRTDSEFDRRWCGDM